MSGKVTDFKEYALLCARAFGACITLRDSPLEGDIPEFVVDDHYYTRLRQAEEDLESFLAIDEQAKKSLHVKEEQDREAEANEAIAEKQEHLSRYTAMLEKAMLFKPPTPEHERFAEFLVEQLEQSIEFDCGGSYWNEYKQKVSFDEWQAKKLADLQKNIEYSRQFLDEEIEQVASRNKWVNELKEALELCNNITT